MSEDIMCRKCGHSMAFHAFYGCCEAPVDGKKLYNRCGCNWTTYNEINTLRKQLEVACQWLVDIYVADGGLGLSEFAEEALRKIGMEHKLDGLRLGEKK